MCFASQYRRVGYQKESPSLRNSFLAAAYELRNGMPSGAIPKTSGSEVTRAITTDLWLDFLGVSLDPQKAEGMAFTINLVTPDNGDKFAIEMSHSTLTNIKGQQAAKPDLTITVNRAHLVRVMAGETTLDQLAKDGQAKLDGDTKVLDQLRSALVRFTPDFELIPGTKPREVLANPATQDPFEAHEPADSSGG